MMKFHMRKVKPFIHILSNFHEFLSTPTSSASAVNWSGSEARFKETHYQLSPRHFENTGSNLFFYVECSYLVNIKLNNSRICWYQKNYNPKYFSPAYVSVSEGGVFQSFPDSDFLPKRLQASEIDKSIRIWLKFTTYHVLMPTHVCTKNYEISRKITPENTAWR